MNLDILIDVDNMLVMNTTRKDMDSFYKIRDGIISDYIKLGKSRVEDI